MATVSAEIAERARKNASAILRAVAAVKQVRVAELLGVSETTVSRLLSEGEMDRIGQVLAACRLKVVPETDPTVDADLLQSLAVLAAHGAQNVAKPSGFGDLPKS